MVNAVRTIAGPDAGKMTFNSPTKYVFRQRVKPSSLQNRLLRMFLLINHLAIGWKSVNEIAKILNVHERTVYRYINTLNEAGFEILMGSNGYKIGTDHYPVFVSFLKKEVCNG